MHYNATDYSHCPYCASGAVKPSKGKKKCLFKRKPSEDTQKPSGEKQAGAEPTGKLEVKEQPMPETSSDVQLARPGLTQSQWTITGTQPQREADTMPTPREQSPERPKNSEQAERTSGPNQSVGNRVQEIKKTTAKYISTSGGEVTYPVVGWLVGVKGVYYGKAFPLKSGYNKVGRSNDMDVPLIKDNSVSHDVALKIVYDSKGNEFYVIPGEAQMVYLENEILLDKAKLTGYEEICLGDSDCNKFVFVPLCGSKFQWEKYPTDN
jgi:hypothetical protein